MSELMYFSDKIVEINKEMGISTASGFLEQFQENLLQQSYQNTLPVDIVSAVSQTAEVKKIINSLHNSSSEITTRLLTMQTGLSRSIYSSFPSLIICMIDEGWQEENKDNKLLHLVKDEYRMALLVNFLSDEVVAKEFASALGYKTITKIIKPEFIMEKTLLQWLTELNTADKMKSLKKLSQLNAIKPLINLLNQIFQSENRSLQVRKLLGAQNQVITRKDEQGANQMELAGAIRQAVQKYGMEIDKNIKIKFEELNKPNTGEMARLIQNLSESLVDFKRIQVAEKSEKVEIKLLEDYEHHFINSLKKKFYEEMQKDTNYIKLATDEMINRVNTLLSSRKLPPINVAEELLDFPSYKNSVTSYLQFNREFKSEIIKKGTMEYFVALRDYTGIIMVATGLLAPLTIIANLSESGFLKGLNNGVKFGMAGITLFLIIYGIHDLRTRIPRKREEEFEKEIAKGREFVINEGKRMSNDISRDWMTALGNWTREINLIVSTAFEKIIKENQQAKVNQLNIEKSQQQRQQQSVDMLQRNISNAERIKETLASRLRELIQETEKSIAS
jgi:hypothetical protein